MGVGMIIIVGANESEAIKKHLDANGEIFYEIGKVVEGQGVALLKNGVFSNE